MKDTQEQLDALATNIREAIPLSTHLDFHFLGREADCLKLEAPLAPNSNDKGTMFAGSITTLATLAGWALTGRLAEDNKIKADVLAVKNEIRYLKPIRETVNVIAKADADSLALFHKRIQRRGRARLTIEVNIQAGNETAACFTGDYLAQQLD